MGKNRNSGIGRGIGSNPQGNLSQSEYENAINNLQNKLPPNDSQLKHIFRNAEGHLTDTPENRKLILSVANDPACHLGTDKYKNDWYARIEQDGTQIWVQIRNGTVQNCGKNSIPKTWNGETGLSNPAKPKQKGKKKK